MKPISLVMTCSACPSQWEGKLDDERMFYARFRHGWFYISVSEGPTDDPFDAITDNYVLELEHEGEGHDGIMSTELMMELSRDKIDWSLLDHEAGTSTSL
jgi:hypothetical protein